MPDDEVISLFTEHRKEIVALVAELEAERLTTGLDGKGTAPCWQLRMQGDPVAIYVGNRLCKQLPRSNLDLHAATLRRLGILKVWHEESFTGIRLSEDCQGDKGIERRNLAPRPLVNDLDRPDERFARHDFLYRHLDGPWFIYLARDL